MKAVLFDYGGVLTEPLNGMFAAVAAECGAEPAELATLLVGSYEDGDHPWHRVERGEISFEELCRWGTEEGNRRGWRLDLTRLPGHMAALELRPAVAGRIAVLLDDFEVNLAAARAIGLHGVFVGPDADAALAELERLLDDGAQAERGRVTSSSP